MNDTKAIIIFWVVVVMFGLLLYCYEKYDEHNATKK